jgi:integrase
MRAVKALSVRLKDIDFDSNSVTVFLRGEFRKTKVDRVIFLTQEIVKQLAIWVDYKYRTRRGCYYEQSSKITTSKIRTPITNKNDLKFAMG